MVYISFVIFTSLLFAAIAIAADNDTGATFLYPPEGLTFNYLDTINVSYTSPFRSPYLVTYCLRYNGGDPLEKNGEYGHAYNSTALVLIEWTEFASCFFTLRQSKSNGSLNTNSPWFRINPEARPTPGTFGLNQNSTAAAPTDSASSTPTPAPSGGLSSGAKIGIGVGVALGVLLILAAAAAVFLLRRRRKARSQASAQLLNAGSESPKSEFGAGDGGHFMPMNSMAAEMHGKAPIPERPHELSSDTAFEMGSDRRIGELSAGEGTRNGPEQSRVS